MEIEVGKQAPGVWLACRRTPIVMRDGEGLEAPVRNVTREPTWFADRSAAEFELDPDLVVVVGKPPPTRQEAAENRARSIRVRAPVRGSRAERSARKLSETERHRANPSVQPPYHPGSCTGTPVSQGV